MPEVQPQRIYFDANVFIYAMETDDERGMLARRWVMQIDRREIQAVTSELTLGEVLPHPVAANDRDLAEGYHRLLRNRTTLMVIPVSRSLILEAVNIRAQLKAELPDAIHIANGFADVLRRTADEGHAHSGPARYSTTSSIRRSLPAVNIGL
jgi:predicted nucleic acid-binding protein